MTEAALQFADRDRIGRVASVDTSHVAIDVTDSVLLTHLGIGQLIAIRGATEREYLIAMTERVTRSLREELPELSEDSETDGVVVAMPTDIVQGVLIGTFRTVEGDKANTFKRGADSFPQIDRECFVIAGNNLQRFMGILGAGFSEDERLKLGTFVADRSADAIASGDKFFQRHAAILGSTGSGKSWAVALILERAAKLKFPNIIVFDMHGEYAPLADKTKGGFAERFRIAGPGDLEAPGDDVLFLPYWLLNRDEMLSMILDRSDQNAPNQASRFTMHVRNLKGKTLDAAGKAAVKKTYTVDSPIPYAVADLVGLLDADNTTPGVGAKGQDVKGEWQDKLTRFLSRLETKLEDRRYGFMFAPPAAASTYDWLAAQVLKLLRSGDGSGIKIIDFSEVPADVLPVVTGTLARLLYDVQFWMGAKTRTPVTLLCDEAHLYLPVRDDADAVQRQALGSFERIAKEGRKYGFSLLVVSQRPSDVSRTILSQCNNFLALRLTNETDQGVIKRL
uniref:ATP-binding protein n=1 Tax=Phenylobacterium sp. TaxID=1871053 RepID=UPI00286DDBCB